MTAPTTVDAPVEETVDAPEMDVTEPVEQADVDETTLGAPSGAEGAEATAEVPVAAVTPEPEPEPVPFAFKAFQQDYTVPGTKWNEAARTLQFDDDRSLNRVRQLLSHAREWEHRGRSELLQLKRENEQLRSQPVAEIEQAKAYLAQWEELMKMDEQQLAQFIMDARTQWPLVQAKAERAYAERLREQAQAAHQPPEPDMHVIVEQVQDGAAELVEEYLANQPWASPEIAQKLTKYLQNPRVMDQYVGRAMRDMPELGLRAGQYAANWNEARGLLDEMSEPYRDAHAKLAATQTAATKQLQQTSKIAAQNAASMAQAKPKPAASRTPSLPSPPKPQTRDDLIAELNADWREMQRAR